MVQELARGFGVHRIARIVVTDKPDPNAYTAWVPLLGNVVVIHSNLLQVLPPAGVRSVIAHEVGHIRRKDALLYQLLNLPRVFALVIAFLISLKVAAHLLESETFLQFFQRGLFILGAVYLTMIVFGILGLLGNLAQQQTELMVDAYAALTCGWETHLNALLLVGERAEALAMFLEALQETCKRGETELSEKEVLRILNRLPPGEMNQERARGAAPGLYILDRLDLLRKNLCVPLTDEQISDLAARAAAAMEVRRAEEAAKAEAEKKEGTDAARQKQKMILTEWRAFDADKSGNLDAVETVALVEELRKDPRRMIFRQFLSEEAQWQDHPTMRDRVLFLFDLFGATAVARDKKGERGA
jgi:hypothetical protein